MTLLDTNIVIAYLNGDERVVWNIDTGRQAGANFCVSAVTVTELLAFPRLTEKERMPLVAWLQESVFVVGVDERIAMMAGDLCRATRLRTADGIIAATALSMLIPIATRDRDFMRVLGLSVVTM